MSARCSELENIHKVIDLYVDGVRGSLVFSVKHHKIQKRCYEAVLANNR